RVDLERHRLLRLVGMLVALVNLELGGHLAAHLGLRKHALNGFLNNLFRLALEQPNEPLFAQTSRETRITAIYLLLALQPSQTHLLGIDDNYVVTHVDIR